MFHRIKSEPQPTANKGKSEDQTDLVDTLEADAEKAAAPSHRDVVAEEEKELSPVQRYARQQQSDMGQDADVELEVQELEEATETDYQEEKESEIMNENEVEEYTEEATQEEVSSYAPGSVAGGYPGSYAGAGYTAPSAPAARASVEESARETAYSADDADGRLVIGRGITMSGEIEACPHLVVEGTVEASLRGAEVLEVSESGVFFGTVEIEEATISGRFEGDITVRGRLSVTETGRITGSITYGELEMEAGASIDGKLTPMAAAQARAQAPKKTVKKKVSAGVSNDADGQLFGQAAA